MSIEETTLHVVAPENDYRSIAQRQALRQVSISVVIPAYNRASRLAATLSGIVGQSRQPDAVIVADDGSSEDLSRVVDAYADRLPISLVRQEHDGFGAGQARNLGASVATTDVVVFIDSDCVPVPGLLELHEWWHVRASGVVVIGGRYHVDGDALSTELVEQDPAALGDLAHNVPDGGAPDDWRALFYRRNRKLQMGDSSFRAVVSSNMSVEMELFNEVGGFPSGYSAWGGEDTDLGWRLWNQGAYIVVANEAVVHHQLEPGEDHDARHRSLELNRMLMADRIPHSFYRKTESAVFQVPRVSWIVTANDAGEVDAAWETIARSTYIDEEVVFVGPPDVVERAARVHGNPRIRTSQDIASAVEIARGELLVLMDGRVRIHPTLVRRAVEMFRKDPRTAAVRCAYSVPSGGTYRRLGDLSAIDAQNAGGAPLFASVRRRDVMKRLRAAGAVAWDRLFSDTRVGLILNDAVTLDEDAVRLPKRSVLPLSYAEITMAGGEETARTGVRALRAIRSTDAASGASSETLSPQTPVRYLGWTGQQNLGDDVLVDAIRSLMPWASVEPSESNPRVLMVGGGTLINANGGYLRRLETADSPRVDRVIFGTGVRSPDYWGVTEPLERWWSIFDSALGVWLRGPHSLEHLRRAGYAGPMSVIGDPALVMQRPEGIAANPGRVLVSPLYTKGKCWGGDDAPVFDALSRTISRLVRKGHDVAIMTAHPSDDRWAIEIMRSAGLPDMSYIPGYADSERALEEISSSEIVLGERLHAVVLAAAVGTPFVGIEYRPKLADFAASVGAEDRLIRTDQLVDGRLDELVDEVLADSEAQGHVDDAVLSLRSSLATASNELRRLIQES